MSRFETSLPDTYFDDLYRSDPDPWRFADSPYEAAKYAATLAALPREHYDAGLEVGCAIGVLTRRLASRCRRLLALDVAAAALRQAERRCADLDNVAFSRTRVPEAWPDGRFDIVLLSEVVYYLAAPDVETLAGHVCRSLTDDGDVVLVHWLGETHYPLSGDDAVELFMAASVGCLQVRHQERASAYRLDVLRARSPSRGEG